jgi:Domain of unknown function (DUF4382)
MEEGNMNFFGTGAAGVLGSGSTPWLLISLGLGLVVLGVWCRKKIFPGRFRADDGRRPHRILPGFPRRDDLRGKDRVPGRGVIPFRTRVSLQPRLGDGEKEKTSKEEESAMRTPERTVRNIPYLLLALTISASIAACGGGGGSATSPGASGPAAVGVSIASSPAFPAGTTFAVSTASPAIEAPPANSPSFDNVFVTVTKLALIPSTGPEFPDPNGELENSSAVDGKGFVTATLPSPVEIDLKHLSGDNSAILLNKFTGVPAGEYSKIRVYYSGVVGHNAGPPATDTEFHQTGNFHFDVHFVGGNLVIPVTSDPQGGIRFFSVVIDVVGLKITSAGNSGNVLMRPQVFAKVIGAPKYIVTGVADQVNHPDGTFVIMTVNDNISAAYGSGTRWFYVDGRFVGPFGISGAVALQDTALVDVIGTFQGGALVAEEVDIAFPGVRSGAVDNGWRADNTFILRLAVDNVVFPKPDRFLAYYDNSVAPHDPLTDAAIDNNVQVKARGYNVTGGIEAYWISIGP